MRRDTARCAVYTGLLYNKDNAAPVQGVYKMEPPSLAIFSRQ